MSCADGERIGDVTAADISTRQPAGGKLRPEGIIIQKFHMSVNTVVHRTLELTATVWCRPGTMQ